MTINIVIPVTVIPVMIDDFIIRSMIAGGLIAIVAGILGCFIVWRKMAFFGDALSHSGLLGIVLGLTVSMNINLGIILICFMFAVALVWLQRMKMLATDTLLGILSHSALSIGLIAFSFLENQPFDIYSYLFGDILTVTSQHILWIFAGGAFVIVTILVIWPTLLLMTLNEDLAQAEGINPLRMQLLFMFLMTITVAISIQIVGVLLITSLLIIPAASARLFSRSPLQMVLIAITFGVISVLAGIGISLFADTPSGPTIVSSASGLFLLSFISASRLRN